MQIEGVAPRADDRLQRDMFRQKHKAEFEMLDLLQEKLERSDPCDIHGREAIGADINALKEVLGKLLGLEPLTPQFIADRNQ